MVVQHYQSNIEEEPESVVDELKGDIAKKTAEIGRMKAQQDAESIEIARAEKDACITLEAAIPALEAAKAALENIQKKVNTFF